MGPLARFGVLVSTCVLAAMLATASPAASAVRIGAAPAVPAGARMVAAPAAATPMHVTVTLRSRDPAGLAAFATEVSTPGSPLYRDYITPAEFAQRFGAAPGGVQAVRKSLRAHGLVPGPVSPNSLSIPVTATAGSLSQAFSTSFSRLALASGTPAIINRQAPSIDSGIASDVQAVLGLSMVATAKPLLVQAHAATAPAPQVRPHVATGGPQPCAAASSASALEGGFTADQIAAAYGLSGLYHSGGPGGAPDEGAGQTVAILELEPYNPTDISTFEGCYSVNTPVASVPVDGGAGSGPGKGEAALDIESVIGLAPQAKVVVYEGPNSSTGPYDTMNAIISQRAAQVVTTSWGSCEPSVGFTQAASENTLFQEAAVQGMTIVSASGDDGSEDCYGTLGAPQSTLAVDDPASQPFVTGVGGTTLSVNPSTGTRLAETAWNSGSSVGASGGGISRFWPMPSYQSIAPPFLHVINGNSSSSACGAPSGDCREVPDVSANGNPGTGDMIYFSGIPPASPWQVVGGTSAAAPVWAALIALTNASAACGGVPIGFANPALYHAAAAQYGTEWADVTSGNNDMTGLNGGRYPAGLGYDMASGLGTPNGTPLAQTLCTDAIALANPGAQHTTVKTTVSLQIKGADTRGAPVTYKADGLPVGLAIDSSTGNITGRPKRIGTSTVTITVADAMGSTAQTEFKWTIQDAPVLSQMSLTSVGAARPTLTFMVAAGRDAPNIKSISVGLPRGLHFTTSRPTVTVTGRKGTHLKFTAHLVHGALVLALRSPTPQVRVTISFPRLAASGSLTAALARHHATRLTLTVRVTDAAKLTTRLSQKILPS